MARASIGKELCFETQDQPGTLGFITISLKNAAVNIVHLSAWAVGNKAHFQIVVSDIEKAKKVLSSEIQNVTVRDVLIVEFENRLGTLSEVAKLLGSNEVQLDECYGTSSDGFKIVGVFSTDDNPKAMNLINQAYKHTGL